MTGTTDSTGSSLGRRSWWSRFITALVGVLLVISAAACTESDRDASSSEVRAGAESDDSDDDEDDSDGYGRAEALADLMAGGLSHEVASCTLDEMERRGIDFEEANESSTASELFGEVVEIVTGCL